MFQHLHKVHYSELILHSTIFALRSKTWTLILALTISNTVETNFTHNYTILLKTILSDFFFFSFPFFTTDQINISKVIKRTFHIRNLDLELIRKYETNKILNRTNEWSIQNTKKKNYQKSKNYK